MKLSLLQVAPGKPQSNRNVTGNLKRYVLSGRSLRCHFRPGISVPDLLWLGLEVCEHRKWYVLAAAFFGTVGLFTFQVTLLEQVE